MTISLIVCAHNEEKWLGACLAHALENKIPELKEIIVIDNASTDKTKEIALSFPGVQVVHESQKGLTRARARGLVSATGDILAYIDADTEMPLGWMQKVSDAFKKNPQLVAVSGPYEYYDLPLWGKFLNKFYWIFGAYVAYIFTGYMIVGGNFAAKRDALIEIGGFDTSIEFYGEDTNIARRLAKAGKGRFLLSLPMPTSARRLKAEGIVGAAKVYMANFLSEVILKKPLTKKYKDIRD